MKPLFIGDDWSGISLEFTRKRRTIDISGYYDSIVGIEGATLPAWQLFRDMGMTPADLKSIAAQMEREAQQAMAMAAQGAPEGCQG